MNDRLKRILEATRDRVERLGPSEMGRLREMATDQAPTRSLRKALQRPGRGTDAATYLRVIGEIKRRSPSAGAIHVDLDVQTTARALADAGCAALSVLTEPEFFGGSLESLRLARAAVDLPLLRKDFIVDERQVVEARAHGADAILLLAAALEDDEIRRLRDTAAEWDLDVLAEAHGDEEMRRLVAAEVPILGLNARDLRSFDVSLDRVVDWADQLAELEPGASSRVKTRLIVAESGILTAADAQRVWAAPVDAALVGEGLMRGGDPGANYARLFGSLDTEQR